MIEINLVYHEGGYIHAERHGTSEYHETLEFWSRVVKACEAHDCYNILCESYIPRISTSEAFMYSEIFPKAGITLRHRVAYVCHAPAARDGFKFVETVLKNRNRLNGSVFAEVEKALANCPGGCVETICGTHCESPPSLQ